MRLGNKSGPKWAEYWRTWEASDPGNVFHFPLGSSTTPPKTPTTPTDPNNPVRPKQPPQIQTTHSDSNNPLRPKPPPQTETTPLPFYLFRLGFSFGKANWIERVYVLLFIPPRYPEEYYLGQIKVPLHSTPIPSLYSGRKKNFLSIRSCTPKEIIISQWQFPTGRVRIAPHQYL